MVKPGVAPGPRPGSGLLALVVATFLAVVPGTEAAAAACRDILPQAQPQARTTRPINLDDLIRLRDIGLPDGSIFPAATPFGISPDGLRVAFVLSRAEPDTNSYCRALVILGLADLQPPRIVDIGGEPILASGAYRGLIENTGFPAIVTPRWSPDGRSIAYLRRDAGITQIWLADAAGGGAHAATRSKVDVEDFAWARGGKAIVFASRPGSLRIEADAKAESLHGYHYDRRFFPSISSRPQMPANVPREIFGLDVATGDVSVARPAERSLLAGEHDPGEAAGLATTDESGRRAWAERSGSSPLDPLVLVVKGPTGEAVRCREMQCHGDITGLWWVPGGIVLFLKREGWAREDMALYRWKPGHGSPHAVLRTSDVLHGCVLARARLLCGRESAEAPRRLVLIDPVSGRSRLLFEPNPEFSSILLGRVIRLTWRNDIGLEARGDLVLPPGYRGGGKLPLIVTQYFSDGFLRGATGDEYPIQAFAAAGFAVLSFERPIFFAATVPGIKTYEDVNAADDKGWAERRSVLSALIAGVDRAVELGIADPDRVGITGLSDGASTVSFALINTRRFAAAAISTCCTEPWTIMTLGGIAYADRMRSLGYPAASSDDKAFWKPASLAANAASVKTPLLMQLSDDEYRLGLEAYAALRENGQPVDMFVFPGEHHIKWQPAHRLAIYRRNLDWFRFWLKGEVDPDPAKAAQYAAWKALPGKQAEGHRH